MLLRMLCAGTDQFWGRYGLSSAAARGLYVPPSATARGQNSNFDFFSGIVKIAPYDQLEVVRDER